MFQAFARGDHPTITGITLHTGVSLFFLALYIIYSIGVFFFFFGANNQSIDTCTHTHLHKMTERVADEDRASDSEVAACVAFLERDG